MRTLSDGVSVNNCSSLSLVDYCRSRSAVCIHKHSQPCQYCPPLLNVANTVLSDGFCTLREAFNAAFPTATYDITQAKRKFLQMPLVSIRIGKPSSGTSYTLLMERIHNVDYVRMSLILNALHVAHPQTVPVCGIDNSMVKQLLKLAQSDRERECIRYTVFKASGLTQTQARKKYGFEKMGKRARKVENVISEVQGIREAIDHLANIEDSAYLATLGILPEDSADESGLDELEDIETEVEVSAVNAHCNVLESIPIGCSPSPDTLKGIITECQYNCFDIVDKHPEISTQQLESFLNSTDSTLDQDQHYLLE